MSSPILTKYLNQRSWPSLIAFPCFLSLCSCYFYLSSLFAWRSLPPRLNSMLQQERDVAAVPTLFGSKWMLSKLLLNVLPSFPNPHCPRAALLTQQPGLYFSVYTKLFLALDSSPGVHPVSIICTLFSHFSTCCLGCNAGITLCRQPSLMAPSPYLPTWLKGLLLSLQETLGNSCWS